MGYVQWLRASGSARISISRDLIDEKTVMKKAGAFMASVAAASSVALPPVTADQPLASPASPSSGCKEPSAKKAGSGARTGTQAAQKKFAPRLDGLRFIETLVTAHR